MHSSTTFAATVHQVERFELLLLAVLPQQDWEDLLRKLGEGEACGEGSAAVHEIPHYLSRAEGSCLPESRDRGWLTPCL